jgi:hypothetical protein
MSGCTMCEEKKRAAPKEVHDEPEHAAPARKAFGSMAESLAGDLPEQMNAHRSAGAIAEEGFSGAGQELPDREAHEKSFGRSFANVRVYADAAAAKACRELNARAYTVGNKIAFADASLLTNKALVAHELTHVGQHTGDGPARKSSGGADDDGIDRSGEDEAERVEAAVGDGKPARSALGGDVPGEGGDAPPAQGPARKAQGPARQSPWGAALTFDAGAIKASGSYNIRGQMVSVPIAAVPGLFAFLSPSLQVKAQVGSKFAGDFTVGVSLDGGIEGGLSYGDCNSLGCLYLSVNGGASGGFEYAQQGPHWHVQGDIKFEAFLAFGVKVLRGWAVDFRQEFAKTELGKLTGIRVIGTYGKLGPQLDGGPSWTWGPDIQALFDKFSGPMKTAAKTFPWNS